jgi:putative ubiquitin-RnfH superfamily antitoxin RatB of RatAB toxin-antitoxin module
MANDEFINVEVAYATPGKQMIVPVEVPRGATVAEAVRLCGIEEHFPGIDIEKDPLGIFGRKVKRDRELQPGDRVEIYRPLLADPKHVRRELAKLGKSMGRGKKEESG